MRDDGYMFAEPITNPEPAAETKAQQHPQPEPLPAVDQLRQDAEPLPAVPVVQVEPLTVHNLPSRVGAADSELLGNAWVKILPADPKRKRATLVGIAVTGDPTTWLYSRTGSGTATAGMPWPVNVPLPIEHCDQVYARAAASDETVTLSYITEVWAD